MNGNLYRTRQAESSMIFSFLAAILTAVCSAQANVPQPVEFADMANYAEIISLSAPAEASLQIKIETPSIAKWSSGQSFSV